MRRALLERRGEAEELLVSDAPATWTRSVRRGRPSVIVPVLSRRTSVMRRAFSSAPALRKRMPERAPRPVPTRIAVGVARPSAQGQAMIRTDASAIVAKSARGSGPRTYQATQVTTPIAEDDRDEDARDPVGELLDRRLRGLRLLDEPHDLRERRRAADGRGLHVEGALAVERAADDAVALRLRHRDRLARDHGLVDRRGAGADHPVDRHGIAGLHAQPVARRGPRRAGTSVSASPSIRRAVLGARSRSFRIAAEVLPRARVSR